MHLVHEKLECDYMSCKRFEINYNVIEQVRQSYRDICCNFKSLIKRWRNQGKNYDEQEKKWGHGERNKGINVSLQFLNVLADKVNGGDQEKFDTMQEARKERDNR